MDNIDELITILEERHGFKATRSDVVYDKTKKIKGKIHRTIDIVAMRNGKKTRFTKTFINEDIK